MRIYFGVECGQQWYWLKSWIECRAFRKLHGGFAIGPLMFWFK